MGSDTATSMVHIPLIVGGGFIVAIAMSMYIAYFAMEKDKKVRTNQNIIAKNRETKGEWTVEVDGPVYIRDRNSTWKKYKARRPRIKRKCFRAGMVDLEHTDEYKRKEKEARQKDREAAGKKLKNQLKGKNTMMSDIKRSKEGSEVSKVFHAEFGKDVYARRSMSYFREMFAFWCVALCFLTWLLASGYIFYSSSKDSFSTFSNLSVDLNLPSFSISNLLFGIPIPFQVPSAQLPTAVCIFSYSCLSLGRMATKVITFVVHWAVSLKKVKNIKVPSNLELPNVPQAEAAPELPEEVPGADDSGGAFEDAVSDAGESAVEAAKEKAYEEADKALQEKVVDPAMEKLGLKGEEAEDGANEEEEQGPPPAEEGAAAP